MSNRDLFRKYDVPAPRYTSYPTVPYWQDSPTSEQWLESVRSSLAAPNANWAMYVHLPFCETLCTFCGCNTVITKNHAVEESYIACVLRELELYRAAVPALTERGLMQMHLGGGTPTYFSAKNLKVLLEGLVLGGLPISDQFEGSVEINPQHCSVEQLEVMREFSFRRVSFGVQDLDAKVQRAVNRVQSFETIATVVEEARKLDYESVNFDLIYGLPYQTPQSMRQTVEKALTLKPDRIAFYSFAMLPWMKPAHKMFADHTPAGEAKRELYEVGREIFKSNGYVEIGMDHFALPSDSLAVALQAGQLHRNFMGYTEVKSDLLLGLGVSSISESLDCYHQNIKVLADYKAAIESGHIATLRGHRLSAADMAHRKQILDLMTAFRTPLEARLEISTDELAELERDGLIEKSSQELRITENGRPFLRNVCMLFDERMRAQRPETRIFSSSI